MTVILTDIQEVTPEWLSHCLGRTLNLGDNHIVGIEVVNARETRVSSTYSLQVVYAQQEVELPTRLFLKLSVPGQPYYQEKIDFYNVIVPAMAVPPMATLSAWHSSPFVPCFDAAYSTTLERAHLLLADMSPTHFTNQAHLPPGEELCYSVIDAYARFHAFWWEHSWLGKAVGRYLTDESIDDSIQKAQAKLLALHEIVKDELTTYQLGVLGTVARAWPSRRRERVVTGKGVTIVHRDPHPLNFLYPNDPAIDSVKLIDWQSWRVDTGTDDLVYLIACHWPLEQHPGLEQRMLEHYLQEVQNAGVQRYGWDDLYYDYRASIIRCLFFLLIAWSPAQWERGVWRTRVGRALDAYERFGCVELLA